MLNLKFPRKLLDLPYGKNQTSLIRTCKENNIEYVDGKTFWAWQAQKQEEIFINRIKGMKYE